LETAALMADGRDAEVLKKLGRKTAELALKIGAVLSGVQYIKDSAEVVDILLKAFGAGQVIKLRRQQVAAASDLLRWADAISFMTLAWCFAAELFVLGTRAKGQTPEKTIMLHVIKRVARSKRLWKVP
jgi:hypothetical protein